MPLSKLTNLYSITPSFHVENSKFYPNYVNYYCSLFTVLLTLIITILYIYDLSSSSKQMYTFIEYNTSSKDNINLSKENFIAMLSISDSIGNFIDIDSNIGSFQGGVYSESNSSIVEKIFDFQIVKCKFATMVIEQTTEINQTISNEINENEMEKMTCFLLRENDIELSNSEHKRVFIKIGLNICNDLSNEFNQCKSIEYINNFINGKTINFHFSNYRTLYNKSKPSLIMKHISVPLSQDSFSKINIQLNRLTYINDIGHVITFTEKKNYYLSTTSNISLSNNSDFLSQIEINFSNSIAYNQICSNQKLGYYFASIFSIYKIIYFIINIITYNTNSLLYQSFLCSFFNEKSGVQLIHRLIKKIRSNSRNLKEFSKQNSCQTSKIQFVHIPTVGQHSSNKTISSQDNSKQNQVMVNDSNLMKDDSQYKGKLIYSPMFENTSSIFKGASPNILPIPNMPGMNSNGKNSSVNINSLTHHLRKKHDSYKPIASYLSCKKIVNYWFCVRNVTKEANNIKGYFKNINLFFDVLRFIKLYNDVDLLRDCLLDDAGSKEMESCFSLKKNSDTIMELYERNFTSVKNDETYSNVKIFCDSLT